MKREQKIERFLKALGGRLRELRMQKGLSLNELAQRCGISRQGIKLIEDGARQPGVFSLLVICEALGEPLWRVLRSVES